MKAKNIHVSKGKKSQKNKLNDKKSNIKDGNDPTGVDLIINLTEEMKLIHTPDNDSYAVHDAENQRKVIPIKSDEFNSLLKSDYYKKYRKVPPLRAINSAIDILDVRAKDEGMEKEIFVRVAENEDAIYIDNVGNDKFCIKVEDDGYQIIKKPKVLFRRPKGMQPLEKPEENDDMELLKLIEPFINTSRSDRILIIAWLVAALRPRGPYPILVLQGQQGSGKTTLARMLKCLIDPIEVPLRSLPTNNTELMIDASNNWVMAFDNVSQIKPLLSDDLCRLSTNAGLLNRKFYTNREQETFKACRPVILNGIRHIITRSDLADRCIVITTRKIDDENRMTEEELWKKFNKSKATILGALLNGVSTAIKRKDKIRLESHPRMADFMHWISAAEPAIFKKDGQFRKAFEMNRNNLGHACMENDPVAMAIRILLDCNDGEWVGNPTDLLYALQDALPDTEKAIIKTKLWPRAANALSLRIGEIESVLHWVGIEVSLRRKSNERRITLKKVNQNSD